MNVGIIFDSIKTGGGGYNQSLKTLRLINEIENKEFNFIVFTSDKIVQENLKSENIESIFFSETRSQKIFRILLSQYFPSKIKNKFENFFKKLLKKNEIDLVFFLGPSKYIDLIEDVNFIVNIWDINHKIDNYFPEFISHKNFLFREKIIKKTTDLSFRIIVDSLRTKNEIIKFYNCISEKIITMPFHSTFPGIYEFSKSENYSEIFNTLKIKKTKYLFFYPAQFWAHKNHIYLLEALSLFKKEFKDFSVIFTGSDKGNLDKIKKQIKNLSLDENVKILNFLDDKEIISLYLHSKAIIIPTYVARTTLPLIEALYFKLPIFYSKDILDESYKDYINEFDLNNSQDLCNQLKKFINNDESFYLKAKKGREFYETISSNEKNKNIILKIFQDYSYLKSKW
jgi:glycosyltransferase involved in cell wall biosynthesis